MENSFFNEYPYTDFHELNLSWVIKELRTFATTLEQFVSINALKYADPIQWDITKQYEKNTIVIDPQTGTAYISVAPVPIGVALTNEDYWTIVFDLGSFVVRASKNFATIYEAETTTTATVSMSAGSWVVWGDTLYIANVNITAGDAYVVDGNIRHITIEEVKNNIMQLITDNYTEITAMIGDLDDLTTTAKDNIVTAINELVSGLSNETQSRQDADNAINNTIGDLDDLTTTDKSSVVNAINDEVQARNDADATLQENIDNIIVDIPRPNLLLNCDFKMILDNFFSIICPVGISYYSDTSLSNYVGLTDNYYKANWVSESYSIITINGTTYYVSFNDCKRGYVGISRTGQYTYAPWIQGSNIVTFFNLRHLDGLHMKPYSDFDNNCYMAQPINFGDDKIDGFDTLLGRYLTASIVVDGEVYETTFKTDNLPQSNVTLAIIDNAKFTLKINYKARDYQDTGYLWYIIMPKVLITVQGVKFEIGQHQTLATNDGNIIDAPQNMVETTSKMVQFEYNPFMRTEAQYVFVPTMGRFNSGNTLIGVLQPNMPFVTRPTMGYETPVEPLYIQQSGHSIKTSSITMEASTVENSINLTIARDTTDANLFVDAPFILQRRHYLTHIWFFVNIASHIFI